jgi:hypothetical protein
MYPFQPLLFFHFVFWFEIEHFHSKIVYRLLDDFIVSICFQFTHISDACNRHSMDLIDIFKFCANYPALVIAVILGIGLWSMVILVALNGGRAAVAAKNK